MDLALDNQERYLEWEGEGQLFTPTTEPELLKPEAEAAPTSLNSQDSNISLASTLIDDHNLATTTEAAITSEPENQLPNCLIDRDSLQQINAANEYQAQPTLIALQDEPGLQQESETERILSLVHSDGR
ncbi:hypothetical protein HDV05_008488, partial [Chytridiales sp. JEL 0842]